jgi:3-hexulose-6-phosphate synthase
VKLQLALDLVEIDEAKRVLDEVGDIIDIVEVGTPLVIREGMRAVREIRKEYPTLELLADLKIMDAGEYEASIAFDAGAHIVTVLGAAHDETICGAVRAADKARGAIMADMIAVGNLEARALGAEACGVRYVCVHTAFDVKNRGFDSASDLALIIDDLHGALAAVAGGITDKTAATVAAMNPAIVVVGGGIINAPNRRVAATKIKEILG